MRSLRPQGTHLAPRTGVRSGFTILELVLAAGLMAILMIAVFALIDGSLGLWRKSETRRNLTEQATGVLELLTHDARLLEGGGRGDLLVEWVRFDTDADGLKETCWPRIRLVRQASKAEVARLLQAPPATPDPDGESLAGEPEAPLAGGSLEPEQEAGPALIEVCWVVLPADKKSAEARAEGLIYRGARKLSGDERDSYFSDDFIKVSGVPRIEELDEVTGGLLWLQPLMATQTSIVHDGWEIGGELDDAATSWDAWRRDRPDLTAHVWNQPSPGMPQVDGHALLPRRIRFELEFERALDRKRRTVTTSRLELGDVAFDVDDARRLPRPGQHLKIEGEWMLMRSLTGTRVTVKRGVRGTEPMIHDAGMMVHWGLTLTQEIPVALYREDWNL